MFVDKLEKIRLKIVKDVKLPRFKRWDDQVAKQQRRGILKEASTTLLFNESFNDIHLQSPTSLQRVNTSFAEIDIDSTPS